MRAVIVVTVVMLVTAAMGAVGQHLASWHDRRSARPSGELVDVGGRRLHLVVRGDGDGPVVVLDGGLSGFSAQWAWVQRHLGTAHTVVAYDRPGLGWSDPDPEGVDPDRLVTDLHTALQRRGLTGPYIVVGHSLGGMLVRVFADRYPQEVAGVVLVDASHPEQATRVHGGAIGGGAALRLLARIGVLRATGVLVRQAAGLPDDALAHAAAVLSTTAHVDATAREANAFDRVAQRTSAAGDLGAIPLTVVTAGRAPTGWRTLQRELADLSVDARHIVVPDATHLSLVTDERHAGVVATEIAQVAAGAACEFGFRAIGCQPLARGRSARSRHAA